MKAGTSALKKSKSEEEAISRVATIRSQFGVKKLEMVVDVKAEASEQVHLVGANSPEIVGPEVEMVILPAEVLAMIKEAKAYHQRAQMQAMKLFYSLDAIGRHSGASDIEGKTVAVALSFVSLSGWGTEKLPTVRTDKRRASLRSNSPEREYVGSVEDQQRVANSLLRFAFVEAGAPAPESAMDKGIAGAHDLSHAERQVWALSGSHSIGVNRDVCRPCRDFFQGVADSSQKPVVITDPSCSHVWLPGGRHVRVAS